MNLRRLAVPAAALCLIALLACCGKVDNNKKTDTGSTAEKTDTEIASADLALDSEQEETEEEERKASADLYWEDGDICTQYLKLTSCGEWEEDVTCHYFQEPEAGRYVLDIVENSSMAATEGTGGLVYSVVLSESVPEDPPGEDYDYLGTLEKEGEKLFHVLVEYPENPQYTEGSEEAYRKILDTAEGTAGRLEGRNGYNYESGEYPGNTEE